MSSPQQLQLTQETADNVYSIFLEIQQEFTTRGSIDQRLINDFYTKLKNHSDVDEIVEEFEKFLAKITKDVGDKEEPKEGNGPVRIKRQAAPLNPQYETEKKQTCVELFADFGSFFNKTISKIGLKYCSESEIVKRSDILTNYNAATNQLGSGQQ